MSQREIAEKFGISRPMQWRATKIAEIPEAEFEAMMESENVPTVSALVEYAWQGDAPIADTGLRALQRAWNRASEPDRVDFLEWIQRNRST